jgi:hypothetical protein
MPRPLSSMLPRGHKRPSFPIQYFPPLSRVGNTCWEVWSRREVFLGLLEIFIGGAPEEQASGDPPNDDWYA